MSSNEEEDEGDPETLAIATKSQEELIEIIQTSLYNIVTRVNTLSKRAVDVIDDICDEADRLSVRVTVLEEQVIQKTSATTYEDQNGNLSLKITKSETVQSTTIQTRQVYSSKQVPVKMCERQDSHGLTSPMNRSSPFCPGDTGGLEVSPDASYCFELSKEKTVFRSEEEMGAKPKQKQHKDRPNKPASVPRIQRMKDNVSVYHAPAARSEASRSHVDQPDERSSFFSFPLYEINKLVTRAVGKAIVSSHYLPMHGSREVKNSITYVRYGTGRGEELKPQPRTPLKTEVFVSPTAPASAPALPADWLAALKASKVETPSSSIQLPTQLPSPVLGTPAATSPAACLPGGPDGAVPVTPPKGDFSTPASEPFPYYELTTADLLAQAEYQGMPPPPPGKYTPTQQVYSSKQVPVKMCERQDSHGLTSPMNRSSPFCPGDTGGLEVSPGALYCFELSKEKTVLGSEEEMGAKPKQKQHKDRPNKPASVPRTQRMKDVSVSSSAVTSPSVQTRATVAYLSGPKSAVQSSTVSVTKVSKSSIPSSPRSSLSSSQSYRIPPPRYPVTPLPRASAPQNSSRLSSISSCPQTSRSWIPSPRNSLSPTTRSLDTTRSRCPEAQPSRPSAAQSQRSSVAQSTRRLIPPQGNPLSVQSAKSSTVRSLSPFVQPPSCVLSSSGVSVTPSAPAPVNATFRQTPPDVPVVTKVKNAVMAAIRKSVLLYKPEDQ